MNKTGRVSELVAVSLFSGLVLSHCSTSRAGYPSPTTGKARTPTAQVTLQEFWSETISREVALKRLAGRNLDARVRERIEKSIPPTTRHFITFKGNAFLEYADFGDGFAHLMLVLRAEHQGSKLVVYGPNVSEKRVETHEYETRDGKMVEDGQVRETFVYSKSPVKLNVETTFLDPSSELEGHPGGSFCCDACEWVHSALGIHGVDGWCCLGCCSELASLRTLKTP
jgi:hypothetical protein